MRYEKSDPSVPLGLPAVGFLWCISPAKLVGCVLRWSEIESEVKVTSTKFIRFFLFLDPIERLNRTEPNQIKTKSS